jgi:hypothetical protein
MGTARSPPIVPPHETVIKTLPPTVVSSAVAIRFGLFLFLYLSLYLSTPSQYLTAIHEEKEDENISSR